MYYDLFEELLWNKLLRATVFNKIAFDASQQQKFVL